MAKIGLEKYKYLTYEEMGKKVAEEALDGYIYQGKALREWIDVLAQTQWIPCSERLPEVGSEVLVCYEFKGKRSVFIADFYGDGEFHGLDDEYLTTVARKHRKAIAWMPLPTPPNKSEIPTGQIVANGELYPGEFDDPLVAEGSDKE